MKRFLSFCIALVASLVMCVDVNAQVSNGDHVYTGTLSNIQMNNKDYDDASNVQFTITSDSRLVGTIGGIGKMPGTINIDLPIYIDPTTGEIEADNAVAGSLSISGADLVTVYVKALTGNANDNTLHFVLDTYGKFGIITMFPASVTFDGTAL